MSDFARRLDELMAQRGLKVNAVARHMGVSHSQVARYLEGSEPGVMKVAALAGALGLSIDEVMGREGSAPIVEVNGVRYVPADPTVGPPEADPASGEGSGRGEPRAATPDLGANADARASRRGRAGQRAPRPPRAPKKDG